LKSKSERTKKKKMPQQQQQQLLLLLLLLVSNNRNLSDIRIEEAEVITTVVKQVEEVITMEVEEVVAIVTSIMVVEENNSLRIKPLRFAADEDEVDLEDHLRTFLIITRLLHGLGAEVEGVAFEEDTMMVMAVVIEDKLPAASFSKKKIIQFYNNLFLETKK
jgi:hypothetical protein